MDQRKYTNQRYMNYMKEGVARLSLTPLLEFNKNIDREEGGTIPRIAQTNLQPYYTAVRTHVSEKDSTASQLAATKVKEPSDKSFSDRPITTSKNHIGKSYYNVGNLRVAVKLELLLR